MADEGAERQTGLRSMALAAFFFSLMSLMIKLVGPGVPNQEVVAIRSAMTLLLTWIALRRAGVSPWGTHHGWLLARGLTGFVALSCFFYSIVHLPLAVATVIQFTSPVLTALLAGLFLRESLDRAAMAGTAVSLLGVVLIARPAFLFQSWSSDVSLATALIALTGALLTSSAYIAVRRLSVLEHPLVVIFYFPLVSLPAAAITAVPQWVWPTAREWLFLIAAAAATQAAQVFLTQGLFREEAGRAASVTYLQVAFATLWGWLVFGEIPEAGTMLGGGLILASVLSVGMSSRRLSKKSFDSHSN